MISQINVDGWKNKMFYCGISATVVVVDRIVVHRILCWSFQVKFTVVGFCCKHKTDRMLANVVKKNDTSQTITEQRTLPQ